MKKNILLLIAIFAINSAVLAQATNNAAAHKKHTERLSQYINQLKNNDKDLQHAVWSVCVADAKTGNKIYEYNSQRSLLPASNMKIVTTGVGLLSLGENFQFKTKLAYSGKILDSTLNGNLYIIGGGDPTLGSSIYENTVPDSVFAQWTNAVRNAGINKINGKIIADTRIFDDENHHGSWEIDDIGFDYGAGSGGIQFMDNLCKLYISPSNNINEKPTLTEVSPYIPNTTWENHITSVADTVESEIGVFSSPYSPRVMLTGVCAIKDKQQKISASIPNIPYTCAWYFDKYLNTKGISTSGGLDVIERKHEGSKDESVNEFYTYLSPSLAKIAWETNKSSNNCFAETILKAMGKELGADGSDYEGCKIVMKTLKDNNVDTEGFKQVDGSGLSRHDYVTTSFLCNYMSMMYNSAVFKAFIYTFPIAGVDGTMKYMLKKTVAANNVKAKSGSLTGVRSYSGYVTTRKNKDLCFSFVVNNYTCKTSVITKKMEKMMIILAEME